MFVLNHFITNKAIILIIINKLYNINNLISNCEKIKI